MKISAKISVLIGALFLGASANKFNGHWVGTGYQTDGSSWSMDLNVKDSTYTIDYPSLKCGGSWQLISSDSIESTLKELITYGTSFCIDKGIVKLSKRNDSLFFKWHYPNLNPGARAVLTQAISDTAKVGQTLIGKEQIFVALDKQGLVNLDIRFSTGSSVLNPESRIQLVELCAALLNTRFNDNKIEILGYTDGVGSKEFNIALSKKRAEAVKDFITFTTGIGQSKITAKGMGVDGDSGNESSRSRRVEIRID